jgi:GT2 family glycosyltransferase
VIGVSARPSVGIAIVNWNSGEQLRDCLASIASADWQDAALTAIVVVDNASTDGSADGLDPLPLTVDVVRNPANHGFAAACNQAAAGINADYLLFLNPDTLVERHTISAAVTCLESAGHASAGIVGVQLVDGEGSISRSCARFPTPWSMASKALGLDRMLPSFCRSYLMTDWDHTSSREVDHVMGAFYLVRSSIFRALGGFDPGFFMYFEDLDFSLRARHAGWRSLYFASVRACHRGGGASEQVKATRLFYSLRSRLHYARKHFSRPAAWCLARCALWLEPAVRLAACATGRSPTGFRDTLDAYRMLRQDTRATR